MRFTFVQPSSFVADWRRLGLTDADLRALELEMMARPDVGPVMSGTGGLRKMRFAPPSQHKGKSGAIRVCYVCFDQLSTIYLLLVFPKNEKANLTQEERHYFAQWIRYLYERTPTVED